MLDEPRTRIASFAIFPMTTLLAIPRYWALLLAFCGACEQQRLERLVEASKKVVVGASEADVLSILGQPIDRFGKRSDLASAFFGNVPRKWAYGSTVDLHQFFIPDFPFPNPIPIKLRLWWPDEGDLVIDWDDTGTVAKVTRPRMKLPAATKK